MWLCSMPTLLFQGKRKCNTSRKYLKSSQQFVSFIKNPNKQVLVWYILINKIDKFYS
jgi:hypothetical protein